MASLVIYAVIAAAALGGAYMAWSGFKDHIGKPYAEAQRVADQQVVDKAERNAKAAETERDNARADTAQCNDRANAQSTQVERWQQIARANEKDARDIKAKAQREATEAAPKIADLQAKAAAAPKLETCEVELSKAKDILRESLRARRAVPK